MRARDQLALCASQLVATGLVFGGLHACTKQEAKTVIDIANATCAAVEGQDPNDPYVTLACTAIDVGGGVAKIFLARVPRQTAAAMLAHCPEKKP